MIPQFRNLRPSAESADRTSLTVARRPKATDPDVDFLDDSPIPESAESADRTSLTAARRPKATDLDAELGGCYQVHDRTLLLEEDA